jgi:adenosine/AMP kinase
MAVFEVVKHTRFVRRFLLRAAKALFPDDRAKRRSFHDAALDLSANLYVERAHALPDDASRFQECHRALVLASVRCATQLAVERAEALKTIADVYKNLSQHVPRRRFQLLMALAPNPLRILQRTGTAKELRRMMGRDMLAKDDVGPHHYALVIEGCAYNDFFRRHGEPDITLVFCQADRAWMDVVNRSKRPLSISRPKTQSTGSSICIFRYENAAHFAKPNIDVAAAPFGDEQSGPR